MSAERDLKIAEAVRAAVIRQWHDATPEEEYSMMKAVDLVPVVATIPPEPVSVPDVDAVMVKAQEFASAWALVDSRFDDGSMLEQAEVFKAELRAMLATATNAEPAQALTDGLVSLIREAANALDDLTPHQTPDTSAAREIARDLRRAIEARMKGGV